MPNANELKSAVAEVLEVDPSLITPATCFQDVEGFDSVKILSLLVTLDDLGIAVPQEKASELRTFGDVLKLAGLS